MFKYISSSAKQDVSKQKASLNLLVLAILLTFYIGSCGKSHTNESDVTDDTTQENLTDYEKTLIRADWDTTWLSDAILWKYYHFENLFSNFASITIFEINLNNPDVKISIPYAEVGSFITTSEEASRIGALAAINGSFFNMEIGGSSVYFRLNNKLIEEGYRAKGQDVGFVINDEGQISIMHQPISGWSTVDAKDILAGGPHLVRNDNIIAHDTVTYAPRTAIGLTKDNYLISVVVDGRTAASKGMTMNEIAKTMRALGCIEAMNLDGGGSSTAYVHGFGVVNYPSDNGKFDHEGERKVANVIAFLQ